MRLQCGPGRAMQRPWARGAGRGMLQRGIRIWRGSRLFGTGVPEQALLARAPGRISIVWWTRVTCKRGGGGYYTAVRCEQWGCRGYLWERKQDGLVRDAVVVEQHSYTSSPAWEKEEG